MKLFNTFIILIFSLGFTYSQQTFTSTVMHDGYERSYVMYIPDSYTGDQSVPLLLNYHGFGSDANQQMWYGDFRQIADQEGFILVHPQGLELNGLAHWNVGGFTLLSTIDDVGFTEEMINKISSEYNINQDRIYSTGMSNGGYMSFLLACQLSDRIAAIASVTGSMTPETYNDCNPQHPTPILQIHGIQDGVVPYYGDIWTRSIDDVLDYWINYNEAYIHSNYMVDNISTTDNSTVIHFTNEVENGYANVEHFQIDGGDHTWPGTIFNTEGTNYDISASQEIWDFFSRYDLNGLIISTESDDLEREKNLIKIYPNPSYDQLSISTRLNRKQAFELYSNLSEHIMSGELPQGESVLSLDELKAGIYYLRIADSIHRIVRLD